MVDVIKCFSCNGRLEVKVALGFFQCPKCSSLYIRVFNPRTRRYKIIHNKEDKGNVRR